MSKSTRNKDPSRKPRRDQTFEPHLQDPYQTRGKLPEPAVCPDCGVVYHKGRWQWLAAPAEAHDHRCPACSRIHDKAPASQLTVTGAFFSDHRDEIMSLVRNVESREKQEHPLERIMGLEELASEPGVVISYTGIHLAKGTGEALHHAYQGKFHVDYGDRDSLLRASWHR
jgi:hypothetical protein